MMSEWYQSESMERPMEWDTTSSPSTVYQHKNIQKITKKGIDKEEDQEVYTYMERTMSREDYVALQAELESPATKMIMQTLSAIELRQEMMEEMMEE